MTEQELIIPSYEVIADYPKSPFTIGDILSLHESNHNKVYTTSWEETKKRISPEDIGKYPFIFKVIDSKDSIERTVVDEVNSDVVMDYLLWLIGNKMIYTNNEGMVLSTTHENAERLYIEHLKKQNHAE